MRSSNQDKPNGEGWTGVNLSVIGIILILLLLHRTRTRVAGTIKNQIVYRIVSIRDPDSSVVVEVDQKLRL